jgi:putative oxidoreductase
MVFLFHGSQKLFGCFGGTGLSGFAEGLAKMGFSPPMFWAALAGAGEFFGGLFLLIGFLTRYSALVICCVMAVAMKVHWGAFSLQHNGIEFALSLFLAAFSLVLSGGGKASIDSCLGKLKDC